MRSLFRHLLTGNALEPFARDIRGRILHGLGDARCAAPVEGENLGLEPGFSFRSKGHHVFFGYYDFTPFSVDDSRILAMRVAEGAVAGRDVAELGYFSLKRADGKFHRLGDSLSWCWQQGCRLQWLPGASSNVILYNVSTSDGYGCVMVDAETGTALRRFDVPVYAVDPSGEFGYSLNFSRLQAMRPGYGYVNHADRFQRHEAPGEDGLWLVDMHSGEAGLIVSLAHLAGCYPHSTMSGARHYLNHIMCNPDGSRVMFMHLWLGADGRRYNRLLTCNPDGSDLCRLVDSGRVSHSWWCGSNEVLAYSWEPGGEGYAYRVYTEFSEQVRIDPLNSLQQDSHPSLSADGSWLVTDTYPDLCRRQWLMLQNRRGGSFLLLDSFFSPSRYTGEFRCDLHPRWNRQSTAVAIDATVDGRRGLYVFDVSAVTVLA